MEAALGLAGHFLYLQVGRKLCPQKLIVMN